ncbi:hypothetical protein J2127_001392 [Methanococcus voltae]|uniref:right-handed parallel beta-helix repeat-containing protein n=1 Tax=Methanococcus voltae TaxID=2188 RepID=UPI001AEA6D13|nr:right-handed parallel beta-helix repeat-containing protein [Methanococcus voltae]MBP2144222.1 hypothetical protein [Methanococcus voltae]
MFLVTMFFLCVFTVGNVHGVTATPQTYVLNAENLTSTYTITLPGVYVINCNLSDINVPGNLINIRVDNVVIDGNNNWLNNTKGLSSTLIYVDAAGATIKNVKAKNWAINVFATKDDITVVNNKFLDTINFAILTAGAFPGLENMNVSNNIINNVSYTPIKLQSFKYATIYNNTITNFGINGIEGFNSYYINITHNTIVNNSFTSIGLGGDGFGISLSTHGSIIAYNTIQNNSYGGALYLNTGNSPEYNYIYSNNFIDNRRAAKIDSYEGNEFYSPKSISYTYKGQKYDGIMGNYWDNCTSPADTDGNGIRDGNHSLVIMGVQENDTHPLVEKWENYFSSGSVTPVENKTNKSSIIHINSSTYDNNRTIIGPGTYILDEDITDITNGIVIQSSDVVIDGNNHKLGTDSTALDVIQVYKSGKIFDNITIKNLKIETPLNYKCNGIMINSSVNNLTIENCDITLHNGTYGIGFSPNDVEKSLNSPIINNNNIIIKNGIDIVGIGTDKINYVIINTSNNSDSRISNNNIIISGNHSKAINFGYSNVPMENLNIYMDVLNNSGELIFIQDIENTHIKDCNFKMTGKNNSTGVLLYTVTLKNMLVSNSTFNITTDVYGVCVWNWHGSDNITLVGNTFFGVDSKDPNNIPAFGFTMVGPITNSTIYLNDFLAGHMVAWGALINCTFESPNSIRYQYKVDGNVYNSKFGNYWFNFNESVGKENPVDNGKGFTTKPYFIRAFTDNYSRYATLDNYVLNYKGNNKTDSNKNTNNNNNKNSAKKMIKKAEQEGTKNGFNSKNIRDTVTNSRIIADDKFDKSIAEDNLKENIQDSEDVGQELDESLDTLTDDVIVVGGPVVNRFAETHNNKFLKPINNENPGENKGVIQVLKVQDVSSNIVASHYVIYIAGSDRYGTQAALEYFKTLNELPESPITIQWTNEGPVLVE